MNFVEGQSVKYRFTNFNDPADILDPIKNAWIVTKWYGETDLYYIFDDGDDFEYQLKDRTEVVANVIANDLVQNGPGNGMKMVKRQRVSIGFFKPLDEEDGEARERFADVYEGAWNFDESKPYDLVPDPSHDYDYAFDEAAAIERTYGAAYHRSNPMD